MTRPGMGGTILPAIPRDADILHIVDAGLDKRAPDEAIGERFYAPEAIAMRAEQAARQREADWPALAQYRAANEAVTQAPDIVMIGDSITEIWQLAMPEMFGTRIVNRGISGQTSPQILLRFMADVIDLRPRYVHILCGGNDIAGNTGPNLPEDYERNIRAMVALAKAHDIKVLIASILPAATIPWQPEVDPLIWVPRLNAWLRGFADATGCHFMDYGKMLDDGDGGLQDRFSADGVHVTRAAYHEMARQLQSVMPILEARAGIEPA